MISICQLINGSFVALPVAFSDFISNANHTAELVIIVSDVFAVADSF